MTVSRLKRAIDLIETTLSIPILFEISIEKMSEENISEKEKREIVETGLGKIQICIENDVSARHDDPEISLQVENTELKKKLEEKENIIKDKEKIIVEKEDVIKNLENQIIGRGKFIMIIESI